MAFWIRYFETVGGGNDNKQRLDYTKKNFLPEVSEAGDLKT